MTGHILVQLIKINECSGIALFLRKSIWSDVMMEGKGIILQSPSEHYIIVDVE